MIGMLPQIIMPLPKTERVSISLTPMNGMVASRTRPEYSKR